MPLFLVSLLKGKSLRYLLIGLMVFSISVGGWVVYNKIWSAGYDSATHEYQQQLFIETQKAVEEARKDWELQAKAAAALRERINVINEDTIDVIDQVPDAVSSSDCLHLGDDVLRLFNESIRPDSRSDAPYGGVTPSEVPGTEDSR
jgi:hypothetical protein